MPELGFSLQMEVYFLRGTYEFARPDHPNIHIYIIQRSRQSMIAIFGILNNFTKDKGCRKTSNCLH